MSTTRACLILKLASRAWLTRKQLAEAMETHRNNVPKIVADLVEEGLLLERQRAKDPAAPGFAPMEYTVPAAWGGQADV